MKKRFSFLLYLAIAAALFLALPRIAAAQDDDNNEQDPPGRVARLNFMQGSVSFQPSGEQDWVQANPNRPLTTGDNLWSDQDSRGELHLGSTVIRISSQTGISFLNLNDQQVQIQLAQGSMHVRVRDIDDDEAYEIDTPNLAFSILRPGDYRFDVDPDGGTTIIVVRSGQGEVTAGDRAYTVTPGQRAIFSGSDELSYNVQPAAGLDEFDGWARSRDLREDHSESVRYVSRDVIGYEDLDTYGRWQPDPTYGNVWIPSGVEEGWAPYHNGHWAFISPWGWTWVEDEPWGFAPFHYGRWTVIAGGRWGWVPGPVAVVGVRSRPYYAPALVGFVGGGGVGVAVGFGGGVGVAWFPLGPRDVYVPSYRVSERYATNINISNTTVINRVEVTNVYRNVTVNHVVVNNYTFQRNTAAVTAVSRETFVNARPVRSATIRVSAEEIQRPQIAQNAALAPSRVSVVGPNAAARNTPPPALSNRRMVTKMAPSAAAAPIGRPRPAVNPAIERANGRIDARDNRNVNRNDARPNATPPPAAVARPGNVAEPNRVNAPPARANENATPPNRAVAPANRPNENPPNRAVPPPNRPVDNVAPANRPNDNMVRPQPKPEEPPKPAEERKPARTFTPPPQNQPRPEAEAKPRPTPPPARPEPEVRPRPTPPPAPEPEAKPRPTPPPPAARPQEQRREPEAKPKPNEKEKKNEKDKDKEKDKPHPSN